MNRRAFLGTVVGTSTVVLAGCTGDTGGSSDDDAEGPTPDEGGDPTPENGDESTADGGNDPTPEDEDGSTPEDEDGSTPEDTGDDTGEGSEYETLERGGQTVPLVPTEDAYEWYESGDLAVLDARSRSQWENKRIAEAYLSPAPDGRDDDDPTADWSTDRRIVTYCGCPHSLSSARAAVLLDEGFTEVYALEDGIQDWIDKGYPIEGDNAAEALPTYEIRGETSADAAGEQVWVREPETGQREPSVIQSDGSYEVTFHFVEIDESTPLTVETPTYEVRAALGTLTSRVVTPALA